jgi:hypothetical protein
MEIRSKVEFYRLWQAGCLGNRTRLTTDVQEALSWGSKEVGFREVGKSGGGAWEKVKSTTSAVSGTYYSWKFLGRNFIMDDSVPNDKQTFMGEVCRSYRGWEGLLGITEEPMRPAIRKGLLKPMKGAVVPHLLRTYMDPSSLDDLYDILDLYPDATVEFSCFSVPVGVLQRPTMFWEVRNY